MNVQRALLLLTLATATAFGDDDFEKNVRPLLAENCIMCHGPTKSSGGLRLDSREAFLKGGDSGPAVVSGKPSESLLIQAVEQRAELRMPPKKRLADRDINRLKEWVRDGLPWSAATSSPIDSSSAKNVITDEHRRWWAFQPLRSTSPPIVKQGGWVRSEIDRSILAGLEAHGLSPSPAADKRTLMRRAAFDLTGLPPTAEDVDAFIRDDAPDAFARVVDRLLASPAYGERWGRHWLDLVRYADTAGENTDHPIPDAWRYRNWVIDAFNRDQPYDRFLRDQVAGDLLPSQNGYSSQVVATGFLGIARRFGHDIDKDMHLTHEDVIDTLGRAFLGLSIACARCHDHKFDPIGTRDYYALSGIFQSTRFTFPGCEFKQETRDLVPLLSPDESKALLEPFEKRLAQLDAELKRLGDAESALSRDIQIADERAPRVIAKGEIVEGGKQAIQGPNGTPIEPIEVKAGRMLRLSVSPKASHGADSTRVEWDIEEVGGNNRRWNLSQDVTDDLLSGNPHADRFKNEGVWWFLDGRAGLKRLSEPVRDLSGKPGLNAWRNGDTPSIFVNASERPIDVWTTLPARSVFVHPGPSDAVGIVWVSPIDGKIQIKGSLADAHSGGSDGVAWTIESITEDRRADLKRMADLTAGQTNAARTRAALLADAPRIETAYAVTEGATVNARIHLRGDPEKLGPEVPRRWLELFGASPVPADQGSGRRSLAEWLSAPDNPLTARVMVNRIWQHHFGKGLVQTPNDFGTRGQRPTHPELLDRLALDFIASGWSMKAMHRRIMLSAVYQQASTGGSDRDPNNDLYGRFDRRRMSAEELRDGLLVVSGRLDRSPGGPHPFPPEKTWRFTQHVPFDAIYETNKRSVYLMTLRNRRHPFLGLFDGADPNASTPQRQVTTVPTQSLYFLNDPFFHRQAETVADRLSATSDESVRLDDLFRLVFQRMPTPRDRETSAAFLRTYMTEITDVPPADRSKAGWAALARIMLASNEFLYVE